MLHKVFNMFVDIPKEVAINIPGLRNPSSLPHLKKVRQKIKNKLKIAEAQLKHQQEISKTLENSSIKNKTLTVSDKTNSHLLLAEKLCNPNKNNIKSSCFNFDKEQHHNNYLFDNSACVSETQNDINKSNQINLQPCKLLSSTSQTKLKKLTCTITSNANMKEIDEISYQNKSSINLKDIDQNFSNTQIINTSK